MEEQGNYTLREDLVFGRRVFSGEVKYVVKDPLRLEYFTVDETSYALLHLADGSRDLADLSEAADRLFPELGLNPLTLRSFYEGYRSFHFFHDTWERNILLIEKRRKSRAQVLSKIAANPFEISLPAWDPDRFFDRIVGPLGFLFTKGALVVYAAVFAAAMWISLTHADEFALSVGELYVIQGKALLGIVTLYVILFLSVVLHEIGHGLTCKHFGGEVHKIGFLFLYFNPCLFCDVTESYFFEDKRKKHAVTFAGGVVDLMTASVATFIWFFTSPDLFINQLAHRIAIYNGVTGIIFNFNPLMKYDGYFILSDHLEIPNLQGDSFRYLGNRIRALFGLPHEEESTTPRERRIFRIYGLLSMAYVTFVLWFILSMACGWLVGSYHALGWILAAGLVLLFTGKYVRKLMEFARFWVLDKKTHLRRWRLAYGLGLVALLAVLLLLPIPRHVRGSFELLPGREGAVRAQEPGVIERVLVAEGEVVEEGAPLVVLREESMGLERGRAASARQAATADFGAALAVDDAAAASAAQAQARQAAAAESFQESRQRRTEVNAPFAGVVMTAHLDERVGLAVTPGEIVCELGDVRTLHAEALVDERYLGVLDLEAPVELRLTSTFGGVVSGRVVRVAPRPNLEAERRFYRVVVAVENADGELRPGMTGRARFGAGSASAFGHAAHWFAHMIRIEFWI